jgi:hypothetical protein
MKGENTNVGGRTDKTLTGTEGRVWRSGEDENREVGGISRQSTEREEGRNRKMHEAVTASLPNAYQTTRHHISDDNTLHIHRREGF